MPIYEYRCTHCEHRLEAIQKMADDPLVECPVCSHPSLQKLISAASFRLKGGGWYETDFKTGKKKQLADSGSEGSSSGSNSGEKESKNAGSGSCGDSKGSSKGDTKGDSKSTSKPSASEAKAKTKSAKTD